ncbi:winged helix DNA-binding domain-containing protein [Nocardioides sp.]|uniref:winged helix DNA-binding domain-containing protein n=1 Tax=Nocardioides sp. TaxID=35761 RepID=UPI003515DE76
MVPTSSTTRHVDDAERRARLVLRQHVGGPAAADALAALHAVGVLHATEPATVYLTLQARVPGLGVEDVDAALYRDRSMVKQLAMRRTLFVFPRDLLPAAWGSASARVHGAESRRIALEVGATGLADRFGGDGAAWLADARSRITAAIAASPDGLTAAQVREQLPDLAEPVALSPTAVWNHGRLLTNLGLDATIVRGVNTQHWRLSRPRWTLMDRWLGEVPEPLPEAAGYAALVRTWLARFGPGTEDDLVWWLGGTKGAVRAALAALEAVPVSLDAGATGWLLPDDVAPVSWDDVVDTGPAVALLPVLDPTIMGWKARDWYLGDLAPALFDRNGNAGTSVWVDGRAVGCWVQDADGAVRPDLLVPVSAEARRAVSAEAERLTAWLDGTVVGTVYPSPAMKAARAGTGT